MPWLIRKRGAQFCVYEEGADGEPTGASRGCHASEAQAEQQRRALYANVEKAQGGGFTLWKEASTGLYRWLSVYSNNYRDDDNPAEIISERSHQTFVEMVNKGIVDYPELWLWHVPVVWGKADFVDYIDGFALAAGSVYPGCEFIAESLSKEKNLATSHGMPDDLILRDGRDNSVITFHITKEISPLPHHRAANKRTGFVLLKGEEAMPFPEEKRTWLAEKAKLPANFIKQLEEHLDATSAEARASGVESKEQAVPAEPVVEATSEAASEAASEPVAEADPVAQSDTPVPAAPDNEQVTAWVKEAGYVTAEEVAAALTEVISPVLETMGAMSKQIAQVSKELSAARQVHQANEEKLKEATPPLSLKELLAKNLIGKASALVEEESALAQDKPREKEAAPGQGPTIVPFLNGVMAQTANGK